MKSWLASLIAVVGLWSMGGGTSQAASPDCAVSGGTLLSWPATEPVWEMCWLGPNSSVGPRGSGMELRSVHYRGILVAKRIHSPLLFAEYTHGTCYRDWMDDGSPLLAHTSTHNQLGTPPDLDRTATTSCSVSTSPTQSFGTCPFGQAPAAGYQCSTGENVIIENLGDHVRLVTQYRADWYMYDSRISFFADGDIEPVFGFGNRNGTENGTTHWHHNYWRFDFDIDQAGGNMLAINDVDQSTEFTSVRGTPGSTHWSVRNPATGRGFRLVPGANDYEVTPNQAGFGYHNVDVLGTLFEDGEFGDGGDPNNLGDCEMHHNAMANGQNIANQDVVLWYHGAVRDSTANDWPPGCTGAGCIPQDSMICKTAGPRLEAFGDWGKGGGTNHIVTANPDMTFTPATLTIAEGDTVTFQNAGGNHNVVATSGPTTFRCANGCDGDGSGGNGNLSTAAWSATVAFPTAGDVTFFCEAHGSPDGTGMAGTITIEEGGGPVASADLGLTLAAAPDPVASGADVTFTANVANAGPDAATEVSLTLDLPSALSYQSSATAGWTCADASGVVTCDLAASIASGAAAPALTIVAEATGAGTVAVDGEVDSGQSDPVPANNAASVDVEITGGPVEDLIFANGFEDDEPGECTPLQLLTDPSFEATPADAGANPNWAGTDTGGDGSPFYGAAARTGSFGAWGGGWSTATTQTWSQSVTVPSGNPRFLNFWRNVSEVPTGGTATLKAFVDGDEVSSFDAIANGLDGDFVSMSVDVSEYADGGEHEISFEYAASGSDDGNVFVDDVTLECQGPAASTVPVRAAMPGLSKGDAAQQAVHPSGKRKRQ